MDDRDLSGTLAFIEAHTTVHKTCRALHLRHQFLPLVAPAIGVTSDLWGEGWLQCRSEMQISDLSKFPLMPARPVSGWDTDREGVDDVRGRKMDETFVGQPSFRRRRSQTHEPFIQGHVFVGFS